MSAAWAASVPVPRHSSPRVAVFTDTIDDINGVALGLRRLAAAASRSGDDLDLVGAGARRRVYIDDCGVVRLPSLVRRSLSIYPEMVWSVPRPGPLAQWLVRSQPDIVQCATPGPIGFGAMASARSLRIPVVAQYHTEVAEYAARMMGRRSGVAAGAVVSWFYRHADLCLAPSRSTAARLSGFGVEESRIVLVPRGTDLSLFSPSHRDRASLARFGIDPRSPVLLYVGRLSREKNLDVLLRAHAIVRTTRPDATLLVVGSGPVEDALEGPGVVRTGPLHGAALGAVYASADVFAFPSETETFGNVVVEAQAAGLPVVVAAAGAAHENVVPGVTGLVADGGRPESFAAAIASLLDDPDRRATMGCAAHRFAQRFDGEAAARRTFALYRWFLGASEGSCVSRS